MTIHQALSKYSALEIELLLAHVVNKPKEFLYIYPEYTLSSYQVIKLSNAVRRRKKGEPIAYIVGYKDFCGLRFKVNKHVLVPRPETEELVESIKYQVVRMGVKKTIRILDVGTGSGCIAIAIANKFLIPNYQFLITASDISEKALEVARSNAETHNVKIKFIQSDLLKNVKGDFDIIVANLPYVAPEWKNITSANTVGLKFEPAQALFAKEHGLYEIRRLLEQIAVRNHKPEYVYLEFDPRQKQELSSLIKRTLPSYNQKFYKDLTKKWRFVEIKNSRKTG